LVWKIINPDNSRMKFVLSLNYDWVQSDELDILTKDMNKSQFFNEKKLTNFGRNIQSTRKIGRNERCPCGSGKKYKKCCL